MIDVSVLICTYNREDMLVNTLKDVVAQKTDNVEIVVIDQTEKHTVDTENYLHEISPLIKLIKQEPSLTKARNRALREAKGNVLIFIDDDVRLSRDFIKEHIKAHQAGYQVVQGRVLLEKHKKHASRPQIMNSFLKIKGRNDCAITGATNTLTGCNFSIEKSVVEAIGFFYETFQGIAIREDADYGIRCFRGGMKMIFWSGAELVHLRSPSGGVDTGVAHHFLSESYYKNELYFAQKHFSKLVCFYYKIRLLNRSVKNLLRLMNSICMHNQKFLC